MNMFMQYYTTLQDTAQAEIVYRYCHPQLGIIYVRCGGKKTFSDKKSSCYRGFHQNVTNTIRIEQETRKRLTEQAELYQAIASKVMDNFADSTVIINLTDSSFEWVTVEGERVKENIRYEEIVRDVSNNISEEYRQEFLDKAAISKIKQELENKKSYSFSVFFHRQIDMEFRRVTCYYYMIDKKKEQVLSIYRDTTNEYLKEKQLAEALRQSNRANRAKTVFLNNMSHDIRTPMNAIIGFTDLAMKHVSKQERCLSYLKNIKTSSLYLLSLIKEDKQKAFDAGMNGHIAKPIEIPKLIRTINEIMKKE